MIPNPALLTFYVYLFLFLFKQEEFTALEIADQLREIRTNISMITESNDELNGLKKDINTILNEAIINLTKFPSEKYPLKYYNALLEIEIATADLLNFDEKSQIELLIFLVDDFNLKFRRSTNALNGTGYRKTTIVEVTIKGRQERITGLRVKYSEAGYKIDLNNPRKIFSSISNPTSEEIVPGIYFFWLTKDNNNIKLGELIRRPIYPESINKIEFYID